MSTTRLGLTELSASQAQKHVSVNETFNMLDGLVQASVVSNTTTAQPGSPSDGDCYILVATHTGTAWATFNENDIVHYHDGAWYRYAPKEGFIVWVQNTNTMLIYDGSNWYTLIGSISPHKSFLTRAYFEEEITLSSGAYVESTNQVPWQSIVYCAPVRVTQAITGATSFSVGIDGTSGKFGSGLALTLGTTNKGLINPEAFWSDTKLRITAAGSNFTGGKVRLACHYDFIQVPQS